MKQKWMLKTGDKVYLRNKKIGLVIRCTQDYGDFILFDNDNIPLDHYDLDLCHLKKEELNIIGVEEIFTMKNFMNLINFNYLKVKY